MTQEVEQNIALLVSFAEYDEAKKIKMQLLHERPQRGLEGRYEKSAFMEISENH